MTQWQPIETAPRDGTPILAYVPEYVVESVCVVEYSDRWSTWYCVGDACDPTHWMPLPEAPK